MGKTKTAFIGESASEDKAKKKSSKVADKVHISGLKGGQRIKSMASDEPIDNVSDEGGGSNVTEKFSRKRQHGKTYKELKKKVDRNKLYNLKDAIELVRELSYAKFDSTLELHAVVKKTGLLVKVSFPNSTGKEKRVEIASESTIQKLKEGKVDFDVLLSTAEFMPKLVPFAKILGPKGMMPNPKNGTLIKSETDAKKFEKNNITIKTEKSAPLVHVAFAKLSMKDEEILQNLKALISGIGEKQIVKAYICSSMSPSVKIDLG